MVFNKITNKNYKLLIWSVFICYILCSSLLIWIDLCLIVLIYVSFMICKQLWHRWVELILSCLEPNKNDTNYQREAKKWIHTQTCLFWFMFLYISSDIQDYFDYIIKKHEALTNNSPIRTCVYTIENRITFKIKHVIISTL